MRFRRSRNPAAAAEPERPQWAALSEQAQLLGYQLIPSGAREETIGRLERERDELLEQLRERTERLHVAQTDINGGIDATEIARELGRLAGEDLPQAVARVIGLLRENSELWKRANASELEAAELRALAIEDAVARLQAMLNKEPT
jgi:hypothetical protein